MTVDAPARAPKQKRKRSTAPKGTKAKTKALQQVAIKPLLRLPAPRPLLLLTYAGPSQQIGSSTIAVDLPRPIERPTALEIPNPWQELNKAVRHDTPRVSSPAAIVDDTPAKAAKQKRKPSAAGKTAGKPARRQKTIKTKSPRYLPTPPPSLPPAPQIRLPLTGVEDQIGSGASAVNLGQSNEQLTEPQVARAEPQPVDAVRRDLSVSSGTRPAGMPEIFGEPPRRPAQTRIRRAYSIGPRIAAIAGFTAAVIGAVLLFARLSPIKPNDTITQHDLIPAGTVLTQNMGAQQHVGT